MGKTFFKYGIVILMSMVGNACYDDLGNYDYQEINELTIVLPEVMEVIVPTEDSVEILLCQNKSEFLSQCLCYKPSFLQNLYGNDGRNIAPQN